MVIYHNLERSAKCWHFKCEMSRLLCVERKRLEFLSVKITLCAVLRAAGLHFYTSFHISLLYLKEVKGLVSRRLL